MTYSCGTCGSSTIVLVPMPTSDLVDSSAWFSVRCGNGHPWVGVPGQEYVITTEESDKLDRYREALAHLAFDGNEFARQALEEK